ncbi:MAG: adenylosuccinate synthase [Clostridia bacterium]|nr:adenylosuccinate synthase [Clostridia bacterium]
MDTCTAIVGINWGDEGKGRIVDLLTEDFDVVVRYQGGGNAGHTIVNRYGEFTLHLLPSGVFRKNVVNILGNGVALDPEHLTQEINALREKGVSITPNNVMISERASLLMPWHRRLDALEEARLKDKKMDTTRKGIGPFYSDKYQKKTILAGELFYPEVLKQHLNELREWKNLILTGVYNDEAETEEEIDNWVKNYCEPLKPFIRNTSTFLADALWNHKRILFEGTLGALRDLDFGIYPYTTSSNVLASYAPIGSGMPFATVERVIGVVKAYSSCVGAGPFVCEIFGDEAEHLRKIGNEYGHRPHRVGPIDLVATRYGVKIQHATEIALTKLDVLSDMDEIPLCVRYKLYGREVDDMPFPSVLDRCEPVIETVKGWKCNISNVRNWWDLPVEAQEYVKKIENSIGCIIKWISVGPERHSIIRRG